MTSFEAARLYDLCVAPTAFEVMPVVRSKFKATSNEVARHEWVKRSYQMINKLYTVSGSQIREPFLALSMPRISWLHTVLAGGVRPTHLSVL